MSKIGLNKKLWDFIISRVDNLQEIEDRIWHYIMRRFYHVSSDDDYNDVEKLCFAGFNKDKAEELECQFRQNKFDLSLFCWLGNYLDNNFKNPNDRLEKCDIVYKGSDCLGIFHSSLKTE